MRKLAREPLVHFILLGAGIFALNEWRDSRRPRGSETARIEVTAAVIERLASGYGRQLGRAPDAEELRGLVTAHIREEVLCREALALGLERDDTIVRRRLAQKMEFLTDDVTNLAAPDEAALREYFTANAARYTRPSRVSFRHVYFSREKRGKEAEALARQSLAALQQGADDAEMGDAFLHGFEFSEREADEIAALFGKEFAAPLETLSEGAWHGPAPSSYGAHLVRVEARSPPQPLSFEQAREMVARDFAEERRRTVNRETFERLRERYEVAVDEEALKKAASVRTAQQ